MDLNKITSELQEKYPDVGIRSIELDEVSGKSTFYLQPTKKSLAFLEQPGTAITPRVHKSQASTITRDAISRSLLDIGLSKDPYDEAPQDAYKKAIRYYYTDPIVGTTTNLLASLAVKGFELDIDDENIKNFYDTWVFDIAMDEVLEWIFLDFFKVGQVTTYKVIAKYEPRVSTLSPAPGKALKKTANLETGAAKKIWSKGHLPIAYTVLNPALVTIDGNLLFDSVSVKLTAPTELKDLLKKPSSTMTEEEKVLVKSLPSDLRAAAESGKELQLDSRLVSTITYRKQPYERYARPKLTRIFDSLNYKKALREADLSTLDGISNYILKITIGNDEFPVTSQAELEAVADLFNTPSKSFDVVWNHTLKVEKIVSPEISSILGKAKYEQVNEDITGGLGMTRALIDGVGEFSSDSVNMAIKGILEEIEYARRQVSRWLYKEFRQIAEAMGFERFPKVRWDNSILKDIILYMSTISQLVDRRMLSYQTALELLGFDYPNELSNMTNEFQLVQDGIFGIVGSPWQQAKTQDVQGAPIGTPSNGRPSGKVTSPTNKKETDPQKLTKKPAKTPKSEASLNTLEYIVKDLSEEEYNTFLQQLDSIRNNN
jgi:hypothetical protein